MHSWIKNITILTALCIIHLRGYTQTRGSQEFGISVGGSYYLGDLNTTPFNNTNLSLGILYKYGFDARFILRGMVNYGKLNADDKTPSQINKSFENTFFDLQATAEYNFIPFLPANKKFIFTPYTFAGLGYMYSPSNEDAQFVFNIPFGIGVKYNLGQNITIGGEIIMKKTFNDYLDFKYSEPNENEPFKQTTQANNKDWYSIFGINITYKINYRMKCHAFD